MLVRLGRRNCRVHRFILDCTERMMIKLISGVTLRDKKLKEACTAEELGIE